MLKTTTYYNRYTMSETQYDDDMPQGDSIISDISLLGPEVDETVELDVDRKSRIALILTT